MAAEIPGLVWANGQPMRRDLLDRDIAGPSVTGVRSTMSGHPAQGLTPERLTGLLRQAENGDPVGYLELAEVMEEKDLHYLSVLGTRKRAVAQLPIEAVPGDESQEAKDDAKFVQDWLDRDTLATEIEEILDAIGKGYSATEVIWANVDGALLPERLEWRDPRWFLFDRLDGTTLRLRGDDGQPEELPPAKFIVHHHKAKAGLPVRGGLARAVAWGWMFKNYAVKDWVAFLEMFGMPIRIGKYDNGASDTDKRLLMTAVSQIGSDAAAIFPKSMEIEFVNGGTGGAPADMWRGMAGYVDDQVSKAVLGQTSSSDAKAGGLGSGQASLHGEVRADIEAADAKLLAATLNRDLVRPMILINRGPRRRFPRLKIGRPERVDVQAVGSAAKIFVDLGGAVSMTKLRERMGLPAPVDDADRLTTPASGAQGTPAAADGSAGTARSPTRFSRPLTGLPGGLPTETRAAAATSLPDTPAPADPLDRAADEALDDWEPLMTPVIAPVEALIAGATTLEQVRDGLAATLGAMDVGQLTELLARLAFGARLAGDVDLGRGQDGG